jgi:hypothetical protein
MALGNRSWMFQSLFPIPAALVLGLFLIQINNSKGLSVVFICIYMLLKSHSTIVVKKFVNMQDAGSFLPIGF